ncbi:DMT family transporter [Rubellimicrobium aerolatum]|uniref:DMT family transporter n=1 Tax=Rubellimicrobium aerolatum TaxID=490979 RepID=A0ABW0SD86_9RHOB|nr:DMT family transporter [Rubellimicrobium aerolatum]MBP1806751.1 S-adenosylmethionine uptake transporter [Rubellimicrobium aerolatum]
MSLSPNLRGAALMTAAMAGFVVSDAAMKGLGAHWPLFQSIFVRGCGTTLVLGGLALALGQVRAVGRRDAGLILLRTVFEMAAGWCYLTALNRMPLANVSAIQQAVPLAVTLGAMAVLGERVDRARLLAILAGLGGVLLILQPGGGGFTWASLLVLGSVAATSARDLTSRVIRPEVPSVLIAAAASAGMALMGGVGAAFVDWQPLTPASGLLLAATVSFVVLGYVASVSAMRVGEIAAVTPFRYTALVMAIGLGAVAFGDVPGPLTVAGAGVVVGTGLYTLLRDRRRARPEEEASPGL